MSTPIDSSLNSPNGSSNEVGRGQMSEAAAGRLASDFRGGDKFASVVPDGGDSAQIATADVFQGEPARLRLGASRSCLFHVAPAPPLRRRRSWLGVMDRVEKLIVAVVVGAIVAAQSSFSALSQQVSDRPRLVGWASPLTSGEPVSLGLTLQGRANDAVVVITGLVPGMTLSIGSKIGVDTWQVPAAALPNVWIVPPTNFIGVADLVAELHLAARTTLDRQRIKLEWLAAIPAGGATGPPSGAT